MTTEEQLAMTTALEQKKAQPRLPLSRMNGKLQANTQTDVSKSICEICVSFEERSKEGEEEEWR